MNNFRSYDYKELNPKDPYCSMRIDSYENFGWFIDENIKDSRKIVLKRNQKIINKAELTRLQRYYESCLREIEMLNKSKKSNATMYALIIGFVGTVLVALSVFAITAPVPNISLCIIFGTPGIICWILPILVYKYIYRRREKEIAPLIEDKYEEIYDICKKGHALLND
ncbi:MAG: hypothetical protein ACK5LC_09445 [Coprobacillaceae bacterium]